MSSVLITMVCDADLCAQYKKVQELRELLTIGIARGCTNTLIRERSVNGTVCG